MIRLRIVYPEELIALARLVFLVEGRELKSSDYTLTEGGVILTSPSPELSALLQRFETETIWAPLWITGGGRALLMESDQIPWTNAYGPIVFVNREYYPAALALAADSDPNRVYLPEISEKRRVTGEATSTKNEGLYRTPTGFRADQVELYLLGWPYFILPYTIPFEDLKGAIRENYYRTRPDRAIGVRNIQRFADLGYAVTLDSFDEFKSLLTGSTRSSRTGILTFPPNPRLTGDEGKIWILPVKVGQEDLPMELSYYRETGRLDPEYARYREETIKGLDSSQKEWFVAKYLGESP